MKRMFVSLMAALLALTMLAGCSKPEVSDDAEKTAATGGIVENLDAEGVYEKMQQTVDGRMATAFTATTEMGAGMSAAVFSMEAKLSSATDVKLSEDPFVFYSNTDLTATLFNQEISESFRIYSQNGEEGLSSYFHVESSDSWYRHQLGAADLLGQYRVTGCTTEWVPQGLTMAGQTQLVDNREAYVLSCSYSAADVLKAISSPFGEISLTDTDVTGVQLAVTYYVDTETFLPVRIEMEYRGMGPVISDLFNKYAGEMLGRMGSAMQVEVSTYKEVLSGIIYDAVEVPRVPEEGISSSAAAADFNIFDSINWF